MKKLRKGRRPGGRAQRAPGSEPPYEARPRNSRFSHCAGSV